MTKKQIDWGKYDLSIQNFSFKIKIEKNLIEAYFVDATFNLIK